MIPDIHSVIAPYQRTLKNHRLYALISSVDELELFMSYHIYSVWDFMNLLKSLQVRLTCTTVPWRLVNHVENARLINEIVLEEESDQIDGKTTSHFLYYVNALQAISNNSDIHSFLNDLNHHNSSYPLLISKPYIPLPVQDFLKFTYNTIQGSTLEIAAAFAFGRETLVPQLFEPLLHLKTLDPKVTSFIAYLQRHIELDGDVHAHLAETMVANLCHSQDDWVLAEKTAINALVARINLWDAIADQISS